jgi:hypothetical protein
MLSILLLLFLFFERLGHMQIQTYIFLYFFQNKRFLFFIYIFLEI